MQRARWPIRPATSRCPLNLSFQIYYIPGRHALQTMISRAIGRLPHMSPGAMARFFSTENVLEMQGRASMGSIFDPHEPTADTGLFSSPSGFFMSRFATSYAEFQLKRKITTYDQKQFPSLAYRQFDQFLTRQASNIRCIRCLLL